MNVMLRCPSGSLIGICLGMSWLVASCAPLVCGQTPPSNPLRGTAVQVAAAPEPAETASAGEAVRVAAHAEPVARVQPALSRPVATQPAAYSYTSRTARPAPRGFVPRHERVARVQATEEIFGEPGVIDQPEAMDWDQTAEPFALDGSDCADCADGCGVTASDCGDCGTCSGCLIPCPIVAFDNIELFAGTQSFSGPLNLGETGSFGFHYGVNWGAPIPCMVNQPFGFQVGYRGVSSNYSGASFSEDSRSQTFLTAGLFRRVDWGLQGGLVLDVLHDEWYYDDLSLTQLRGELSWVFPACHELGFFFTSGTKTSEVSSTRWILGQPQTVLEEYEPTDLYAGFYRRRFEAVGNGYGRIFAGFAGDSGGVVGADFSLPLTENWALKTGFTYLIPQDGNNRVAYLEEAWNVGITMVWYPGRRKAVGNDYFRPLFDVADNGVFIPRPVVTP